MFVSSYNLMGQFKWPASDGAPWEAIEMSDERKTVLVIIREQKFVFRISQALSYEGWGVVETNDSNEGIAVARRIHPDLIIVGLLLPRRSGFLVLERLRKTGIICPAMVVTQIEGERHQEYAELLGKDDCFLQGAPMSAVVTCVSRLLDHSLVAG